jgi:ribulose 1,5-bisphosphate synthetase/thiazole synthase
MRVAPTKRVPRALVERKRQFVKALALAELTAAEWAGKNRITPTYLSRYLAGKSVSQPMGERIDAFIAQYLPDALRRAS